jgi:hypothetical protein
VHLPSWVSVIASLLPTPAFTVIRKNRYLASQLGSRIVNEKMDAAQKGLDIDSDIYGFLGECSAGSSRVFLKGLATSRHRSLGGKEERWDESG